MTPGTRFVTLGGAVANDVHGKNHHRAGSFGNHVVEFELLRSDGERIVCSPELNPEWFAATVGGLGLTGLITARRSRPRADPQSLHDRRSAALPLARRILGHQRRGRARFRSTRRRGSIASPSAGAACSSPRAMRRRARASCPSRREKRRNFVPDRSADLARSTRFRCAPSMRSIIASRFRAARGPALLRAYLYPLDSIENWNRIYGRRGFYQYQCVLPPDARARGRRRTADKASRAPAPGRSSR